MKRNVPQQSSFNPSNSMEHQEIVLITEGFRPDFNKEHAENGKFSQQPPRTMKTMKKSK